MLQITNHPLYKKHNIDSAMSSLWEFYRSRFILLFLISFIMSLIIQYGSTFINIKELQTTSDPMVMLEKIKEYIVPILIISVISLFFSNILHYYVLLKPMIIVRIFLFSAIESLKYFIPYIIILIILAFLVQLLSPLDLWYLLWVWFFLLFMLWWSPFLYYLFWWLKVFILVIQSSETVKLSHRNFWNNIGWTAVFLDTDNYRFSYPFNHHNDSIYRKFRKDIIQSPGCRKNTWYDNQSGLYYSSLRLTALTLPLLPIFGFILYFNGKAREAVIQVPSYGDENYK